MPANFLLLNKVYFSSLKIMPEILIMKEFNTLTWNKQANLTCPVTNGLASKFRKDDFKSDTDSLAFLNYLEN